MKKVLLSLAICGLAFSLNAQKAPNLVTVDVNKALAGYTRLQDAQVKFESSVTTAREELEAEGEKLRTAAEEINKLQEESENPALNTAKVDEIKKKIESEIESFRAKEAEFNQLRQRTERTLGERRNNIISLHLDEVKDAIKKVCKDKGATLALNVEGSVVLYADSSFDITNDVLEALNTSAPAAN
ncbi:MAG: OmpH family outer membrane protein [Opitutales bacterium]|nr:OmpH family outer membrane protein [Opitutales bacterium]